MALQSVVYASVSQTVGRDQKVGREVLASGSRKCVEKHDFSSFILVSLKMYTLFCYTSNNIWLRLGYNYFRSCACVSSCEPEVAAESQWFKFEFTV